MWFIRNEVAHEKFKALDKVRNTWLVDHSEQMAKREVINKLALCDVKENLVQLNFVAKTETLLLLSVSIYDSP